MRSLKAVVPALLTLSAGMAQGQMIEVAGLNSFHAAASDLSLVPGGLPNFPEARYTNFGNKLYRTTTNQWYTVATVNTTPNTQDQVFVVGTGRSTQVLAQEGVTSIGVHPLTMLEEFVNFSGLAVPRLNETGQWAVAFAPIPSAGGLDQRMVKWDGTAMSVLYPGDVGPEGRGYQGAFNGANIFTNGQTAFLAPFSGAATNESAVSGGTILIDIGVTTPTGQSTPTDQPWTDLDTNGLLMDASGAHYIAQGNVGLDTTIDQVVVVDGVVRVQEGTILAGSGFTAPVLQVESVSNNSIWMDPDGTWYVLGRNADTTRWVVRNGVVIARSGTPITPGSTELWDTTGTMFRSARGGGSGHYVINGNTNSATLTDDVVVVDGAAVVARESAPVDLNADGTADDSLYVHLIQDSMVLMDDGYVYFASRLKSDPNGTTGAGGSNNSSLLRVRAFTPVLCGDQDFNGDGDFGTDQDIEAFFACLAGNCCATCFVGGSDFNGDGDFGTDADIEAFFRVLGGGSC
jgi:hypothetical protein